MEIGEQETPETEVLRYAYGDIEPASFSVRQSLSASALITTLTQKIQKIL
jgi:hypothetical protein